RRQRRSKTLRAFLSMLAAPAQRFSAAPAPCGMSRYSMLTIPPLKNLQQGYRSVTATGGPRNAGISRP
ncbi:TPA: hypothetical protein ACX3MK_005200, partial [Raoultella ornithinolytica]